MQPNEVIVQFGDVGERFYLTLKGTYAALIAVQHNYILLLLKKAILFIESEKNCAE